MIQFFQDYPALVVAGVGTICALFAHYWSRRFLTASAAAATAATMLMASIGYVLDRPADRHMDGWLFIALVVAWSGAFAAACVVGILFAVWRWGHRIENSN